MFFVWTANTIASVSLFTKILYINILSDRSAQSRRVWFVQLIYSLLHGAAAVSPQPWQAGAVELECVRVPRPIHLVASSPSIESAHMCYMLFCAIYLRMYKHIHTGPGAWVSLIFTRRHGRCRGHHVTGERRQVRPSGPLSVQIYF